MEILQQLDCEVYTLKKRWWIVVLVKPVAISNFCSERSIVSSKKKRQRITVLDSEGEDNRSEDDDSYAESASDDDSKVKSSGKWLWDELCHDFIPVLHWVIVCGHTA